MMIFQLQAMNHEFTRIATNEGLKMSVAVFPYCQSLQFGKVDCSNWKLCLYLCKFVFIRGLINGWFVRLGAFK